MPFRFYFFLLFFSFLFLFYPGENPYIKIFAYNPSTFIQETPLQPIQIKPIPVINNTAPPFVTAEGVYVVELDSFSTLYEKNSHTKFFPASTTKIITALVSVDLYQPDRVITINQASVEGQIMNLVPHERITAENLLYGILVHSGNDAAYALANEHGFDDFITLMNTKAQEIGMKDSHFKNPAGLDDFEQMTTPFDLALAGRELLQNPYLRKMVSTKEIIISDVDYRQFHTLSNVNKLLGEIQGLGGLKTGYTELAGENLVSFYRKDNHDYIIVILKSQDRFLDTRTIVNWINTHVQYVTPSL
ncbi:MAG TPA: serine hydrolase [Candidatus Woesebacteria bacterium]|nr:serine hydrolase [Candidatus Woesebacteria bacterium]